MTRYKGFINIKLVLILAVAFLFLLFCGI